MTTSRIVTVALLLALAASVGASADRLVLPASSPTQTFQTTGLETVVFGGSVYFAANDGVKGNELWRTDGTTGGTALVQDINPGNASSSSNPRSFRVVGNRLFFVAGNGTSGNAVYVIDDSAPQLTSVDSGVAGSLSNGGTLIGAVGDKALLVHYDGHANKLYALGQSGSTFAVLTPSNGTNIFGEPAATVGGWAYFGMTENSNSATEPYRTNGTTVEMVKDIVLGINGSQPTDFIATGDLAYFTANDGNRGRELWVTNGTDAGTQLVHQHHPLDAGSSIINLTPSGNTLYYTPDDPATGAEVWRTEGTDASTRVVKDIDPGPGGSGQFQLRAYGSSGLFFLRGSDVWVSDGSEAGTTKLNSVDGDGYGPRYPTVVGSRVYFTGGLSDPGGSVLWRSDGTAAGTFGLTRGAFDGVAGGNPDVGPTTKLGDKVIFTALYPHAAGDPVPASARRIYVLDTTQADETRQATTPPTISGTAAVGSKLTGDKGAWTLEPNRYTYAWTRDGTPIPNATGTEYTPSSADLGKKLTFRVTAAGIGGPNVVTTDSAPVTVGGTAEGGQTPGPGSSATPSPSTTATPSTTQALTVKTKGNLKGKAKVGSKLKLALPAFAQSGVKLTFKWYANGKRIKKQAKSSLRLAKKVKGKRITLKITVSKAGYKTLTLTLGPTKKVKKR